MGETINRMGRDEPVMVSGDKTACSEGTDGVGIDAGKSLVGASFIFDVVVGSTFCGPITIVGEYTE
jgi:hypothetical protein